MTACAGDCVWVARVQSRESGSPKSKVINLNWTCVRRQSTLTEIEIRERGRKRSATKLEMKMKRTCESGNKELE